MMSAVQVVKLKQPPPTFVFRIACAGGNFQLAAHPQRRSIMPLFIPAEKPHALIVAMKMRQLFAARVIGGRVVFWIPCLCGCMRIHRLQKIRRLHQQRTMSGAPPIGDTSYRAILLLYLWPCLPCSMRAVQGMSLVPEKI